MVRYFVFINYCLYSKKYLDASSSSSSSPSSTDTTNLPRYKTLLEKYTPNNEQSNSTTSNPTTLVRNYFNPSTSSTNRRKRSISNDYNSSKRFRSLQSSTSKFL